MKSRMNPFLLKRRTLLGIVVLAGIFVATLPQRAEGKPNELARCLRNCALCKEMYAGHFKSKMCGKFCLKVSGKYIPDCGEKNSIAILFMDRLE